MDFPNDTERHLIIGMNGTGKTVAGLWSLQKRSYDKMPWVVVDYKRDPTIARIPGLEEISYARNPPRSKGLYVIRPVPEVDDEAVEQFLWKIWRQERTGLFLDEGYMLDRYSKAWKAILTQGRSKRVPMIVLSQRPAWISPFAFSESNFMQVFFLPFPADLKRIREWIPNADPINLPEFHSYWWNVKRRQLTLLKPVPNEDEILDRFASKRVRRLSSFL